MPFKKDAEGVTTEEYLNWRCFLQKYIIFRPLVTVTQEFSGTEQILASKALSQWKAIKALLVVEKDKTYARALEKFEETYLKPTAQRDQKRYLQCHCFKPKDMSVRQFEYCIKEINHLIDHVPKMGDDLSGNKKLVEISWFAMPHWNRDMAEQARFDYSNETFDSVLSYFSCLQVIESMVDTAKGLSVGKN